MAFLKKEISYIKDSLSQITKALFLVLLFSSGLLCALLLRSIGTNGTIIAFVSIFVEILTVISAFFILRKYVIEQVQEEKQKTKSK